MILHSLDIRLLDIGGSGVKTIKLVKEHIIDNYNNFQPEYYVKPDWKNFAAWADDNGLLDSKFIGISCAGFILPNEEVKLFRAAGWRNKEIVREIRECAPSSEIFLRNDAEAHLMAHDGRQYENPKMSISLGTSLGFAVSNGKGKIMRPLDDNINYDIGEVRIPTKARNKRVWSALGSKGLEELKKKHGKDDGIRHFGYRLGAFLASICSIFRPKTVVFSGGITEECWDMFQETMLSEFERHQPDWLKSKKIRLVKSEYGKNAALVGIAKIVINETKNR